MTSITKNSSLHDYQDFVKEVYGRSNERHFSANEMLTNISRFSMRALKGVRKNEPEKIMINLLIAMSWFVSLMSQLSIDLEESVWKRFPYVCSYCGQCPCVCREKKIQKRVAIHVDPKRKPKTIHEYQAMFNDIYPATSRTLEHAGIHLAEEVGELSEAVLQFRGQHTDKEFAQIVLEASDLFSCYMGVFNSVGVDYHEALVKEFSNGCHVCHQAPCVCKYDFVLNYKS